MNRRKFLKIAGSTAVIAAAGGAGFALTRTPTAALVPWADAESSYTDPMRQALSYAILAPNPHNRQPWIVNLKSQTEAVLTCDLERLLPATDPFDRQIVIGLGCFLELFSIAAAEQGYLARIQVFPEGEPNNRLDGRPIAHLTLDRRPGLARDPLFAHILARRTNRNPYDTSRAVRDDILQRLRNAAANDVHVDGIAGGKRLDELRTLTRDAMRTEIGDTDAYQESVDLMRIGRREIEANPDGIALKGAFLETLSLAGILTRKSLADPTSESYRIGLEMTDAGAMSSMGFVWINTPGNGRQAQIAAGQAYMRVALQTTADGLAMQPMSQALQEYAAMAPYYETVHDWLAGRPGERVQMLARVGYAEKTGPAPRWPLTSRLKNG